MAGCDTITTLFPNALLLLSFQMNMNLCLISIPFPPQRGEDHRITLLSHSPQVPDAQVLVGQWAVATRLQAGLLSTDPVSPSFSHCGAPWKPALLLLRHLSKSNSSQRPVALLISNPGSIQTVRKHGRANVYWPCSVWCSTLSIGP